MAFLCPSQLTLKRKDKADKRPFDYKDVYQVSKRSGLVPNSDITPSGPLCPPAPLSPSSKTQYVPVDEEFEHGSIMDRRIKAATSNHPANVKVRIVHDFYPENQEQVHARCGEVVRILYQKNDWVFVRTRSGKEGFVPYGFCAPYTPRTRDNTSKSSNSSLSMETEDIIKEAMSSLYETLQGSNDPVLAYFPKRPYGPQMTVVFDYQAQYENDVTVGRGDFVMLLNDDDPEWFWVLTEEGEEGFVPRSFVIAHTCDACREQLICRDSNGQSRASSLTADVTSVTDTYITSSSSGPADGACTLKGTRLIVLNTYRSKAIDDLNVNKGEFVYANLKDQLVVDWLWAYSPSNKKTGFIPESYVQPQEAIDI